MPQAHAIPVADAGATRWRHWWLAARPRTLTASVVPVAVALSLAPPRTAADAMIAAATLAAAVLIQVAVNFANDCFDAEAGIDTEARLGPVRAVQAGLISASAMKRAFVIVLALAVALGIPLVLRGGLAILAVGVASIVCAWAYAGGPRPLASLGLGDVFVFLFFGVVPVAGTVWLQRGSVGADALVVSVPIALLAVAILVVNNLRDIPTDARAGKRTLAVRLGDGPTRALFVALVIGAFAMIPVLALRRPWALVAFLSFAAAVRPLRRIASGVSGGNLIPVLGDTGRLQLAFGALLAAGLAVSG
jgi:1,4-dihydroxy-2-naphthoate octaprenyltransferase